MGKILAITLLFFPSAALTGCTGKISVVHVPKASANTQRTSLEGALYTLPRTVVRLEASVERIEQRPGKHAEVADLFFPDRSLVKADEKPHAFRVKKATVSSFGEPDPDQMYLVKAEGRGAIEQAMTFDYTEQGAVLGAQATVDNQTTEVLLGTLSFATGLVTRVGDAKAPKTPGQCQKDYSSGSRERFLCFLEEHPELIENFSSLPPERQSELLKSDKEQKLLSALEDYGAILAYIVATTALRQDTRLPATAETSRQFIVSERDRLIEEKIAKDFIGRRTSSSWTGVWEFRPERREFDNVLANPGRLHCDWVMQISAIGGICNYADLRGKDAAPPMFWAGEGKCIKPVNVLLDYALDGTDQVASRTYRNFKPPASPGFRYAIPAQVKVTLIENGKVEKAQARLMISQFGWIAAVPETLGGKAVTYDMKFYEATGALKTFKLASKPMLTKGVVDSISSSANALLDDRAKDRAEAEKKADRLNQLERERKLAEEEFKLRDFCAKLGRDCRIP